MVLPGKTEGTVHSNISCNQSTVGFLDRKNFLPIVENIWRKNMRALSCPTSFFPHEHYLINGETDGMTAYMLPDL